MTRKYLALAAFGAVLLLSRSALAQEHVVGQEDLAARLAAAESARQGDLASVDHFLSSPQARTAAARVGADTTRLRSGLGTLDDAELAELSARVEALQSDPVAGLDDDIKTLLVIFLIVAIVILVLKAVD